MFIYEESPPISNSFYFEFTLSGSEIITEFNLDIGNIP